MNAGGNLNYVILNGLENSKDSRFSRTAKEVSGPLFRYFVEGPLSLNWSRASFLNPF